MLSLVRVISIEFPKSLSPKGNHTICFCVSRRSPGQASASCDGKSAKIQRTLRIHRTSTKSPTNIQRTNIHRIPIEHRSHRRTSIEHPSSIYGSAKMCATLLAKLPHPRAGVGIMCHTLSKNGSSSSEFLQKGFKRVTPPPYAKQRFCYYSQDLGRFRTQHCTCNLNCFYKPSEKWSEAVWTVLTVLKALRNSRTRKGLYHREL